MLAGHFPLLVKCRRFTTPIEPVEADSPTGLPPPPAAALCGRARDLSAAAAGFARWDPPGPADCGRARRLLLVGAGPSRCTPALPGRLDIAERAPPSSWRKLTAAAAEAEAGRFMAGAGVSLRRSAEAGRPAMLLRCCLCLLVSGGEAPPPTAGVPSNFCAGSNYFGGPSMAHSALQDQYSRLSSHDWAGATSSDGANAANSGWLGLCNRRFHVCTRVGYWGSVFPVQLPNLKSVYSCSV